ncbi:anti-sigma factor [Rudaeicoccus suwonensis]|uniref:Regulator of SigK n=1 Tax=Rudaeicoccus suwonensis TaxID=657409 RepID=A0A561E139_9MICO|nr:anti-sigma factor [Rudaeicoccus suwonensis]TWE09319.1 anti-sigma-K factor RskA [Rudaeicoccus suwonensis]
MNDAHIDAVDYVMDGLSKADHLAATEHLATCAECREDVAAFAEIGATLAGTAPPVAPPPSLRANLLAQIAVTSQDAAPASVASSGKSSDAPIDELARRRAGKVPRRWRVLTAAAAAVVLLVGGGAVVRQVSGHSHQTTASAVQQVENASDKQVLSAKARSGTMILTASSKLGKALITLEGVSAAPRGWVYQAWMLTSDGPVSAGFVTPGHETLMKGKLATSHGAAITMEPAGGSVRPTTAPIATVMLS